MLGRSKKKLGIDDAKTGMHNVEHVGEILQLDQLPKVLGRACCTVGIALRGPEERVLQDVLCMLEGTITQLGVVVVLIRWGRKEREKKRHFTRVTHPDH